MTAQGKVFRLQLHRTSFEKFNYAGEALNFLRNSVIETVILRVGGWLVGLPFLLC